MMRISSFAIGCVSVLSVAFLAAPVSAQAVPTTVVHTEDGWQLLRDGKPYFVKGAGGTARLDILVEAGGNSIRTWGEGEILSENEDGSVRHLLDEAHELGLTVCVGFWVHHPRHGADYSDPVFVQEQLDKARAFVRKWKDHPAVLMWGVGNEVTLDGGGDNAALFRHVNDVAKVFKEEDPYHVTMTAIPGVWPNYAQLFEENCPDIDILGINIYGGMPAVPQEIARQGYLGPYLATEYGAIGHWETAEMPWGAEVEQSSLGKARTYTEFHRAAITNQPDRALGGYVFLWTQKQERTETWFSMFMPTGEKTPVVDAMAEIWSGKDVQLSNRAPLADIIDSSIGLKKVAAGSVHSATIDVVDPDGDPLSFEWYVREESSDKGQGGDAESVPPIVPNVIRGNGQEVRVTAPDDPGAYRLFVTVRDGNGAAGYANVPFFVESER